MSELEASIQHPQAQQLLKGGLLAMWNGKVDESINLLIRSIQIQPTPEAYIALSGAYERKEDWERALRAYETLANMVPNSDFAETAKQKIAVLKKQVIHRREREE